MKISYLPVLPTLRELYSQPRTMQRFHAYIETLTGGTDVHTAAATPRVEGKNPVASVQNSKP